MTAFDDLDIFAPFDDDVEDYYHSGMTANRYQPKHERKTQRKPMNTAIKFAVRLVVFVGLAYAGLWLTWQFALLLNTVTTQVWK